MSEVNRHITNDKSAEELISRMSKSPEEYKQIQVFLHREGENHSKTDYKYLMVTPNSFGKVELQNLNVEGNYVVLEFLDCCTQLVENVKLDIHDNNPQTFFFSWQDIRKMVFEESTKHNSDELLELEY